MILQLFKLSKPFFYFYFFNDTNNNELKRNVLTGSSFSHSNELFYGYPALPQSQLLGVQSSKFLRADGKTIEAAQDGNVAQSSTTVTRENVLGWAKNDKRRLLHVVYRVGDLDKTIKYVYMDLPQ